LILAIFVILRTWELDSLVALDTNLWDNDSVVSKKSGGGLAARKFLFIGGRLCIDFANTIYAPGDSGEVLSGFDDFVAFLEAGGAVDGAEARRLRTVARARPRRAATAFARALALRDMLRELLAALAAGEPARRQWVEVVNEILRSDLGYRQLVAREDGWSLATVASQDDALAALVPVARSAAELIQEGPGAPVRKCASPTCVLYFYDASPTGRRRWCSMAMCGNRTKVAAHARRERAPD
jgi:predicted RNA-binding Zn ribbon-like protein